MEFEFDGQTYQIERLGLRDALECQAHLHAMGFFDDGLEALMKSPDDLGKLERLLFRTKVAWLNEQGSWVPLDKTITANHFDGRLDAYFAVLVKAITHNYESFLAGGWTTGLMPETSEAE